MNWGNARNEPVKHRRGCQSSGAQPNGSATSVSWAADQRHGVRDDQRHSAHHSRRVATAGAGSVIGCNEREHVGRDCHRRRVMGLAAGASCADAATPSRSSNAPNLDAPRRGPRPGIIGATLRDEIDPSYHLRRVTASCGRFCRGGCTASRAWTEYRENGLFTTRQRRGRTGWPAAAAQRQSNDARHSQPGGDDRLVAARLDATSCVGAGASRRWRADCFVPRRQRRQPTVVQALANCGFVGRGCTLRRVSR